MRTSKFGNSIFDGNDDEAIFWRFFINKDTYFFNFVYIFVERWIILWHSVLLDMQSWSVWDSSSDHCSEIHKKNKPFYQPSFTPRRLHERRDHSGFFARSIIFAAMGLADKDLINKQRGAISLSLFNARPGYLDLIVISRTRYPVTKLVTVSMARNIPCNKLCYHSIPV